LTFAWKLFKNDEGIYRGELDDKFKCNLNAYDIPQMLDSKLEYKYAPPLVVLNHALSPSQAKAVVTSQLLGEATEKHIFNLAIPLLMPHNRKACNKVY
jgi:hypothetical protein